MKNSVTLRFEPQRPMVDMGPPTMPRTEKIRRAFPETGPVVFSLLA